VIKKVLPDAVADTGFGITLSKATFASGDVGRELLQDISTVTADTIHR
jgi:hypothetical protein